MKKTIITTVVAATLSISSVSFAAGIEKAERYSASLKQQQTVGEMNVSAVKTGQEIVASPELSFGLGSNAEVQDLGKFYGFYKDSNGWCAFCNRKDGKGWGALISVNN